MTYIERELDKMHGRCPFHLLSSSLSFFIMLKTISLSTSISITRHNRTILSKAHTHTIFNLNIYYFVSYITTIPIPFDTLQQSKMHEMEELVCFSDMKFHFFFIVSLDSCLVSFKQQRWGVYFFVVSLLC